MGKKGKAKKGGASVRAAAASSASSQMKPLPLPAGVKEAESSVVTMRDDNGNAVYELGQCACMLGVGRVRRLTLRHPLSMCSPEGRACVRRLAHHCQAGQVSFASPSIRDIRYGWLHVRLSSPGVESLKGP